MYCGFCYLFKSVNSSYGKFLKKYIIKWQPSSLKLHSLKSSKKGIWVEGFLGLDWPVGIRQWGLSCLLIDVGEPSSVWLGQLPGPVVIDCIRKCTCKPFHGFCFKFMLEFQPWLPSKRDYNLKAEIKPFLPWVVLVVMFVTVTERRLQEIIIQFGFCFYGTEYQTCVFTHARQALDHWTISPSFSF